MKPDIWGLTPKGEREYLQKPNRCVLCGQAVPLVRYTGGYSRTKDSKKKKFCSPECYAAHRAKLADEKVAVRKCKRCGVALELPPRHTDGRPNRKTCCNACVKIIRLECKKDSDLFVTSTKDELYKRCKNPASARQSIATHALVTYRRSGQPFECSVCGYNLFVDIAHVRAVGEFPGTAKIGEINAIENLRALCPNHHREQENGLLILD